MDELTESNERLLLHRKAVHRRMIRMARMEDRTATQTVANSGRGGGWNSCTQTRTNSGVGGGWNSFSQPKASGMRVEDGIALHNLRLQA